MFDLISFSEFIVILIIALLFLGPTQIPNIARFIGKLIAKIKYYSNYIQGSFSNYINNDEYIENLTKSAKQLKKEIKNNLQEIKNNVSSIQQNIQFKDKQQNYIDNTEYINDKINKLDDTLTKRSLYLRSLQQRQQLIKNMCFNYKKYKLKKW